MFNTHMWFLSAYFNFFIFFYLFFIQISPIHLYTTCYIYIIGVYMIYTTKILKTIQAYDDDIMYDMEANYVSYVISYDELNKHIILKESATYLSDGDEWGTLDQIHNYYTIDIIKDVSIKEYVQTLTYFFNNSYVLKDEYDVFNKVLFDDNVTIIS